MPAAKNINEEKLYALFSHKLGARLAGLGWIGKSCLLVTEEHGPRVRFVSVLADAPLESTSLWSSVAVNAWSASKPARCMRLPDGILLQPREARYDAYKCKAYFNSMEKEGRGPVCGMCLYACPHGRKFH